MDDKLINCTPICLCLDRVTSQRNRKEKQLRSNKTMTRQSQPVAVHSAAAENVEKRELPETQSVGGLGTQQQSGNCRKCKLHVAINALIVRK